MTTVEQTSDSELDDPKKITDAASCLDYLKRREVFLFKMMNDPSHKAMLYFLEVLMNSEAPLTVEQLAARFTHKSFSPEMREACGGGSPEGLREFLLRYPSLFHVRSNDQVDSVAIELPGMEGLYDGMNDSEACLGPTSSSTPSSHCQSVSNVPSTTSAFRGADFDSSNRNSAQRNGRFRITPKSNDSMNRAKLKSTSSLSLESTPSNASSSSESMSSFGRTQGNERGDTGGKKSQNIDQSPLNASNTSLSGWTPKRGIYQPPPLREQNGTACDMCPSKPGCRGSRPSGGGFQNKPINGNTTVHPSNGDRTHSSTPSSCNFCPLCDLVCHHHCSMTHNHHLHHDHLHHHHHHHPPPPSHPTHHHHGETHCPCSAAAHVNSAPHCCSCCAPQTPTCDVTAARTNGITNTTHSVATTTSVCALPPMEKLVVETEAVRFFQQRLLKRDERWVPIKSLAGHLSQASATVRSVVGPQLEFRGFLLSHPHVFEVQGELVSVKDPFGNYFPLNSRRTRERFASLHQSLSSTNLSTMGGGLGSAITAPVLVRGGGGPLERTPRPKSLILSGSGSLLPSPFIPSGIQSNGRRLVENRRSTHFADSYVTNYYTNTTNGLGSSGHISSDPSTPTGNHTGGLGRRVSEKTPINSTVANTSLQTSMSRASDVDTENPWSMSPAKTSATGLSLHMSANEYRAIMFLRKVLEKRGGSPQQEGLSLNELMLILSTKAPDSVQPTIGWTKVELEEFIRQQPIFFEIYSFQLKSTEMLMDGSCQKRVRNKRLEKMINIVITGTKPVESNQRTLTNQCGRIFHVAKLWGIIDLGKHEHVFFDKSIFKHVDDLQKYFKTDDVLYFNAILASKESRAKWRATQVWKECDREYMEGLNGPTVPPRIPLTRTASGILSDELRTTSDFSAMGKVVRGKMMRRHSTTPKPLICMHPTENEDTEADEEIELDHTSHGRSLIQDSISNPLVDSDCEFALNGEEDIEEDEPFISAIARQEGLHLANDIKFISDDVSSQGTSQDKGISSTNSDPLASQRSQMSDNQLNRPASLRSESYLLTSEADSEKRNNFVTSSTEHTPSECPCPKPSSDHCDCIKEDNATSSSSTSSSAISIAVQTVSTGEIMATQLYHDMTKEETCLSG